MSNREPFRLTEHHVRYPELKKVVEDLNARRRGFKDASDLLHWEHQLTPEELERWVDGTKEELEVILAERSN